MRGVRIGIVEPKRHGDGFTAAYLDGHAKYVTWSKVWFRDESYNPPLKGAFDPRQ